MGLHFQVCQMPHLFLGLHLVPSCPICIILFHHQIKQLQIIPNGLHGSTKTIDASTLGVSGFISTFVNLGAFASIFPI
jgi:hypothetical protein